MNSTHEENSLSLFRAERPGARLPRQGVGDALPERPQAFRVPDVRGATVRFELEYRPAEARRLSRRLRALRLQENRALRRGRHRARPRRTGHDPLTPEGRGHHP